jgi:hypothetical protein
LKAATKAIVALSLVLVIGAASVYYLVEVAPEPNLQLTAIKSAIPVTTPLSQNVQDQGLVSSSGTFSYTASLKGSYYLTFDNSFSIFSSKSLSVSYSVAGKQYDTGVSLRPGDTKNIFVALDSGGQVSGSFTVSGGSGNDVNFYVVGNTCTEVVSFASTLVNSGPVSGYASVAYQSDGSSIWTNKYFVPAGQQVPISGSASLSDCGNHNFTAVVTAQQKG